MQSDATQLTDDASSSDFVLKALRGVIKQKPNFSAKTTEENVGPVGPVLSARTGTGTPLMNTKLARQEMRV